jgi:hypothetical protein
MVVKMSIMREKPTKEPGFRVGMSFQDLRGVLCPRITGLG